jgi:predicted transposase/invertase (TIGR01784 family)
MEVHLFSLTNKGLIVKIKVWPPESRSYEMGIKAKKSQDVNNPHDVRLKELFRNKGAFICLLKDCVKPEWADNIDINSLKQSETSFILQDFRQKEADIVYEATVGDNKVVFYVLMELQSRVDYRMPYRLLLYITEILRHYYNKADTKERRRKNFKFPVVIPIVFYNGGQKWTAPANLKEMFDDYGRFGDSLINFNYALVDANEHDEISVQDFRSGLLKIMMLFEAAKSHSELHDVINKYQNEIKQFNEEETRIYNAATTILRNSHKTDDDTMIGEAPNTMTTKEVDDVFEKIIANEKRERRAIAKQAKNEGIALGIEEGREEGRLETAKALLDMGLPIEQIAKATNLTIERLSEVSEASVPYTKP